MFWASLCPSSGEQEQDWLKLHVHKHLIIVASVGSIIHLKKLIFYTVIESIFKVRLGKLNTGVQVQGKTVKYRNGFLQKNCKDV
jgi:hypothetical protein